MGFAVCSEGALRFFDEMPTLETALFKSSSSRRALLRAIFAARSSSLDFSQYGTQQSV
jgi:hypothetical protein